MINIWAKIMKDDKIQRDMIYSGEGKLGFDEFFSYLSDICTEFDIPTPLLLTSHFDSFENFNIVKFKPDGFVESVDFDSLVLEQVVAAS